MANMTGDSIIVEEMPSTEVSRLVDRGFKGYTKLVKSIPGGVIMGPRYADFANKFRNFAFRPDDVVVMTYPKSGTTWLQETVWAMRNINNLQLAEKQSVNERCYFIDADGLYSLTHQLAMKAQLERFRSECLGKNPEDGIVLQLATATTKSRVIKTHLPLSLYDSSILDVCKVIYVCRDPRDVCVSYYHHCRSINTYQFEGSFEDFAHTFMEDDLYYGSYWQHVATAWRLKDHPNLHLVFYEDMKYDTFSQMKRLNDFLGCRLTEEQLEEVANHASFDRMKERDKVTPMTFSSTTNSSEGSFFRKGTTGDWKNVASTTLDAKMSEWVIVNASAIGTLFNKYS